MDMINNTNTLRRIALKNLEPDLTNVMIVGIIIGKQRPRKFADTKNRDTDYQRAVWNFTLRDSLRDYINVTFWGKPDAVFATNDKFYTGDVVEIRRPRVEVRKFDDHGEQFRPMVTSPYHLTLSDQSEMLMHRGETLAYRNLLTFPTKPISGYVPLRDIHNEGSTMKDRHVDVLGAVRTVGVIKNIKTRTGQETQLREIAIFDHTSSGLKVTIWDTDVMTRANSWKARSTILFITDARVDWSNFLKDYGVSLTSRSIVTENPVGKESEALATYARSAPLEASAILDQLTDNLPDPASITNVMSVQQIHNKITSTLETDPKRQEAQFTALLYVMVTKLDLDGLSPITSTKCTHCRNRLKNGSKTCEEPNCPVAMGTSDGDYQTNFDIRLDLTDHTGTLINCRLSGATAEAVLDCSMDRFLRMTDSQKAQMKWKFLMERCAVRIMILLMNKRNPLISVVTCTKASPVEVAQKMPVY